MNSSLASQWKRGPRLDEGSERFPRDIFHRDERSAMVFAGVEDRDDVRVAQASGGAGFLHHVSSSGGVIQLPSDELDRDVSVQDRVTGEVYLSHAAPRPRRRTTSYRLITLGCRASIEMELSGRASMSLQCRSAGATLLRREQLRAPAAARSTPPAPKGNDQPACEAALSRWVPWQSCCSIIRVLPDRFMGLIGDA